MGNALRFVFHTGVSYIAAPTLHTMNTIIILCMYIVAHIPCIHKWEIFGRGSFMFE